MANCTCLVCVRWRRWMAALKPETPEAIAAVDEIYDSLSCAETDSVYWRMKFDGTWDRPSAAERP